MDEDTAESGHRIDAGEANRLAQELNRRVTPDIPVYSPEGSVPHGDAERRESASDVVRDAPDHIQKEGTFPPDLGGDMTMGGSEEDRHVLELEEER